MASHRQVYIRSISPGRTRGIVEFGALRLPCALGRAGLRTIKREGDGATPVGLFALAEVRYRADRLSRPSTGLPLRRIQPADGWCDAPGDRNYNRPVDRPYPASAETMWRDDAIYDVVVVLDHNRRPRVKGAGSAIFMHVARPDFTPTEGCIALHLRDLLRLLAMLGPRTAMVLQALSCSPRRSAQTGTSPITAVRSIRRRSG